MVTPKVDFADERRFFKKISVEQIAVARNYYEMGISAEQSYQQIGAPGRAVTYKLFKFWDSREMDRYEQDIDLRQIQAKAKLRVSIDRLLFKAEYQLNLIENAIEADRSFHAKQMEKLKAGNQEGKITPYMPDPAMETLRLKCMDFIKEILDDLANIQMTPIMYEMQENQILDNLTAREARLREKLAKNGIKNKEEDDASVTKKSGKQRKDDRKKQE